MLNHNINFFLQQSLGISSCSWNNALHAEGTKGENKNNGGSASLAQ